MKRFFRLLSLSSPYRRYFIISCVFMVIYTVLNGISISAVPVLVDRILAGRETELPDSMQSLIPFRGQLEDVLAYVNSIDKVKLLMWIGIMVLVIFVLKGVSLYLSQVTMEIMGQRVTRDIRSNLYNKYYRLPMNYFVRSRIGELMTRITSDVNLINEVFSGRFVTNIKDTLQAVPFLAWMFILDWKLSLMLIVVVPLFVFPVAAIGRKIRKLSRKTLEKIADISSVINETISGIRIVKIFCMEDYEQKRFYNQLDKYKKIRIDVIKKEALYNPLTEIIGGVVVMFVLIIFPRKVMSGEITQGFLIAYLICLAAMIKPLRTIGKINFALQNAMAALQRIFDLLGAPEGTSDAGGAKIFPGIQESVMFQNVSFGYASDEPVLKGVDFEAGINKITAIVGPSGCGKTTLVNLIPRFFDPWKGVI
ncbi:MAG: ABC transporter ATP-binding protein, partial [Candidatus Aureabacteria bacterium]|nr:ABC transporter ATP-binding protein [Candidatus Auribacterota bacterium]